MQVGPLAQVLIGYAQGHKLSHKWAGEAINRVSAISKKQVTPVMLHSTLGPIAARAIRASMLADLANKHWDLLGKNIATGDAKIFVKPQFSNWVVIKEGQIANYQAVVPTTWNAGPRDEHGSHGPYEASLLGNPVADVERPLEVLAPCIPSIPALPAPSTPSIRTVRNSSTFPERGTHARNFERLASEDWREDH